MGVIYTTKEVNRELTIWKTSKSEATVRCEKVYWMVFVFLTSFSSVNLATQETKITFDNFCLIDLLVEAEIFRNFSW